MDQVIQMIGALLVLGAFIAAQQHHLTIDSPMFLALNALGTGILAVVAAINGDLGFTLLEGVWAIISLRGFARAITTPDRTVA
ncbi:MAG: hypothetical protein AB1679_04060 [Actinomycetota bacterium]|jgi:hypothetical protein